MDFDVDQIARKLDSHRNKRIVLVGGSFDILHIGHINFLRRSKEFGDVLVVHVLGDTTVKKYKGKNRPFNSQFHRAELIDNLKCVDFTFTNDLDALQLEILDKIKPDIVVRIKREVGHIYYEGNLFFENRLREERPQIEIKYVAETPNVSTTDIVRQIRENADDKNIKQVDVRDLKNPASN